MNPLLAAYIGGAAATLIVAGEHARHAIAPLWKRATVPLAVAATWPLALVIGLAL